MWRLLWQRDGVDVQRAALFFIDQRMQNLDGKTKVSVGRNLALVAVRRHRSVPEHFLADFGLSLPQRLLVFLVALLSPMSAYARGALLELEEPAVDLPHRGHDPLGSFDLVAFWTLGVENLSRRESEKKWFSALPTKRGGCLQEVD